MNLGPRLIEQYYDIYNIGREDVLERYQKLARILSGMSFDMGILPCEGFIAASEFCHFVFRTSPGMGKPRTLRQLLSSPLNNSGISPSIKERFSLAIAVLYVHAAKLVHRNIRPENFLSSEDQSDQTYPYRSGTAVLMGFDLVLLEEDKIVNGSRRDDWEKNIYMHPKRQGEYAESGYNMLHDIYSLGVVLLEIALWKSFVVEEISGHSIIYKLNPWVYLFHDSETKVLKQPDAIQATLIQTTKDLVPMLLGDKYRDIVLVCLNSLEGGLEGTEGICNVDGIIVSLVFIQKVWGGLKEISV